MRAGGEGRGCGPILPRGETSRVPDGWRGGVKTLLSFGVKRVREIQKGSLTLLTFVDYVLHATVY